MARRGVVKCMVCVGECVGWVGGGGKGSGGGGNGGVVRDECVI